MRQDAPARGGRATPPVALRGRVRCLAITAEQFTAQFLDALNRRALPGFRHKLRSVDLLLVDDVQFFGNKKATLEELLYTIDALHGRQGQVVLTSDRPVAELRAMNADLGARLAVGSGGRPRAARLRHARRHRSFDGRATERRFGACRCRAGRPTGRRQCAAAQRRHQSAVGGEHGGESGPHARTGRARAGRLLPAARPAGAAARHPARRLRGVRRRAGDAPLVAADSRGGRAADAVHVAGPPLHAGGAQRNRRLLRRPQPQHGGLRQAQVRRLYSPAAAKIVVGDRPCQVEDAVRRIEARLRTGETRRELASYPAVRDCHAPQRACDILSSQTSSAI